MAYVTDDVFDTENEFQVLVPLAVLDDVADTDADSDTLPDQDREREPVEVMVASGPLAEALTDRDDDAVAVCERLALCVQLVVLDEVVVPLTLSVREALCDCD